MNFLGVFRFKQTFSPNVAKFRLIQPSTYNSGIYVHFFYLGPIRTNESQRAINKQKLPQITFLGLFKMQTNIFTECT